MKAKGWIARVLWTLKQFAPFFDDDAPVEPAVVEAVISKTERARVSAEKLAQCVLWSDEGQIQCTRPDGAQ